MGKYHPHGDAAIYDTVVRMAQDFSMRYLLVDGQGNFGSIDGDSPAAMRYTEIRLTRLSEEMLREDIDKETVDWVANYDGSEREPVVLPARFPNLLVNGSAGIAVGMATNIPPHNLSRGDRRRDPADRQARRHPRRAHAGVLPGPDFPTGGFIHGVQGIHEAYVARGRGSIQVRAKAQVEDMPQGPPAHRRHRDPLPGQQGQAGRAHRRARARRSASKGISDLRDESDRKGIRIVVELKTRRDRRSHPQHSSTS